MQRLWKLGFSAPSKVTLSSFVSLTFLNEQVNIIAESKKSKVKIVETKPLKRKVTEDLSTSGKRYRLQKLSDVIDQGDLKLISEGHATNDISRIFQSFKAVFYVLTPWPIFYLILSHNAWLSIEYWVIMKDTVFATES